MCGFAGFLDRRKDKPAAVLERTVIGMANRLVHRGPDDEGAWVDGESGIALGHRRLSIVDLSPTGHQPMASASGRFIIAYNGEIYNFRDLRKELETDGTTFRGHSDTEVMLAAVEHWGIRGTLPRLVGMFAFALWDRQDRTLVLARDHLGIKPLYWAVTDKLILFGSELKALRTHPDWHPSIDRNAVAAYMHFGYVPAPSTIWQGAHKLEAGHLLVVREQEQPEAIPYWTLSGAVEEAHGMPFARSDHDAVEELDGLLQDAVRRQMIADVPLGAFLSGGIDSSTVVALMQAQSHKPVKTFTIGFHEAEYDEAQHAKTVARHLGTDHTEMYVTPSEALSVVPRLSEWYDEPFADSSQIPTYLVSRLARQHVTVSLSGDGGDESFGGYNRYFYAMQLWRQANRIPRWAMSAAARTILAVPSAWWDLVGTAIPKQYRPSLFGEKIHKLASTFVPGRQEDLYRRLISQWHEPNQIVVGALEHEGRLWDSGVARQLPEFISRMQYFDTLTYLPDDILTKVDRASMAVGLEARVPLLDHRVVEFAWRLPVHMKYRHGRGKWLLREVLKRYVPEEMVERPKMGFGVPIDHWLRNELADWAADLLSPSALARHGLLNPKPIQAAWHAHSSNEANLQYPLWTALMLQDWLNRQGALHPCAAA